MFHPLSVRILLGIFLGLQSLIACNMLNVQVLAQPTPDVPDSTESPTSSPSDLATPASESQPPRIGVDSNPSPAPPQQEGATKNASGFTMEMFLLWVNTGLLMLLLAMGIGLLRQRNLPLTTTINENQSKKSEPQDLDSSSKLSPGTEPKMEKILAGSRSSQKTLDDLDKQFKQIKEILNQLEKKINLLSLGSQSVLPESAPVSKSKDWQDLLNAFSDLRSDLKQDIRTQLSQLEGNFEAQKTSVPPETHSSSLNVLSDQQSPDVSAVSNADLVSNLELVEQYNSHAKSLKTRAIPISETEKSQSNRRMGGDDPTEWSKDDRGNYWILQEQGKSYIVPKGSLAINEYNLKTVEVLFECQGYRWDYGSFRLIKPAEAIAQISGGRWIVEQRGILEFS